MKYRHKYLHEVSPGHLWLDHRLTPEARAMFCAMASRAPVGGIKARYAEVVDAVAESNWDGPLGSKMGSGNIHYAEGWKETVARTFEDPALQEVHDDRLNEARSVAEDQLCEYPLHPRVQKFFDLFVGKYGHSSVMELTGSPSTYTEGVSWYTAYRSFDNELVAGQEFSTRAVRHRDWPMARECFDTATGEPHPLLQALHDGFFEVNDAEVEWWHAEFTSSCPECDGHGVLLQRSPDDIEITLTGLWRIHPPDAKGLLVGVARRTDGTFAHSEASILPGDQVIAVDGCTACGNTGKKYPTADKEPFRPALDKARWSLPGTLATGFSHAGNLRVMARVIQDGIRQARTEGSESVVRVWQGIADTYAAALPGLAGIGLSEAVYSAAKQTAPLPAHLHVGDADDGPEVEIDTGAFLEGIPNFVPSRTRGTKAYLDPFFNHLCTVGVAFRCSLAVARDWHRHRTLFPWFLDIVWEDGIKMHSAYEPKSEIGKARLPELLRMASEAYMAFKAEGDHYRAMLCLPLGTLVRLSGQGGLRNVVYMLELRRDAVGANFEYQAQAVTAVRLLTQQLQALREIAIPGVVAEKDELLSFLGLPPFPPE